MDTHRDRILDQFTRQAVPFSTAPNIRNEETLRLLVEAAGAGPEDSVLDVACGPGLVVCAFARVVRHATGIDLTPAMLERARQLQTEEGLTNVTWRLGDVCPLPFPAASFSIVSSRFAFHHFQEPEAVFREMVRVAGPGGRVALMDVVVSEDPAKAAAFNAMEVLRDPSHTRALPLAELEGLFASAGLPPPTITRRRLEHELEGLLARSFPNPDDADRIRELFEASLADDALGLGARREGDRIRFHFPAAILVATVPSGL